MAKPVARDVVVTHLDDEFVRLSIEKPSFRYRPNWDVKGWKRFGEQLRIASPQRTGQEDSARQIPSG